ncbi:hypothetical protein [Phenylobacterium sp. J367]|uniref:hypothetical protein n=1 Tax=Phenylobacterium sp. J367 TaxID=2898435 RepID=UPI002150E1EB|nr:hypothetical protein [Phenylobacterium sp. J367]MCR5881250.1 hypothetical protein [Phenylobacterium sp. J367]
MNGDAKSKLAEVLERRARDKAAAAVEQLARVAAESQKEAHREAIRRRWTLAKEEIGAAVDAVNAEIAATGMSLSWSEKPRGDDHAGLAQLFITLEEEGYTKERQVVFNVSALGLVQPVTLIPHTGRKIPDFKIDEVAPDHYEGVIVDFIDQCVSKKP